MSGEVPLIGFVDYLTAGPPSPAPPVPCVNLIQGLPSLVRSKPISRLIFSDAHIVLEIDIDSGLE